jgi:hypothetical protein
VRYLHAAVCALALTALDCGGTPVSPSTSFPVEFVVRPYPAPIKAVRSPAPSSGLADDGQWWIISYRVTVTEMYGLTGTIDNYDFQFTLTDGTPLAEDKPSTPDTISVAPHDLRELPAGRPNIPLSVLYVHVPVGSSATTPSGVLRAVVHYTDARRHLPVSTTVKAPIEFEQS